MIAEPEARDRVAVRARENVTQKAGSGFLLCGLLVGTPGEVRADEMQLAVMPLA